MRGCLGFNLEKLSIIRVRRKEGSFSGVFDKDNSGQNPAYFGGMTHFKSVPFQRYEHLGSAPDEEGNKRRYETQVCGDTSPMLNSTLRELPNPESLKKPEGLESEHE